MLGVKSDLKIENILGHQNIAEDLDDQVLGKIASEVIRGYTIDEASRKEWIEENDEAMKVARQVMEKKTFPFPNSANVKYPLTASAALQFAARAYPELIQGREIVKAKVNGLDPDGSKKARAERVSQHMSFQLTEQMTEWEEEFDKLLHVLPIMGCMFRKTYWDTVLQRNRSDLCVADDVVVNNDHTRDLDSCRRITHKIYLYRNEIVERERAGIFIEGTTEELKSDEDSDDPHQLLEQHCWIDLDGDGYDEPYIVTVNLPNQKVLRIVARYDEGTIQMVDSGPNSGKVERIEPIQYFTKFSFIPDFEGKFYDYGFGRLLYPINESVNTTINQLLDAGALSNLQSGFLSKQFGRVKNDTIRLRPGEFKVLDLASHEMKDGVSLIPAKEPSSALFSLLGILIEAGRELASSSDIMSGQQAKSHVPATTTLALLEQGLKVFNAVFKRLYRSLTLEYKKLFRLNFIYLQNEEYFNILDEAQLVARQDYSAEDMDIRPVSDPNMSTDIQQMARAEALLQSIQLPGVDGWAVTRYYLKALKIPEEELALIHPEPVPQEPPPPDPAMVELQHKMETEKAMLPVEIEKIQSEIDLNRARAEELRGRLATDRYKTDISLAKDLMRDGPRGNGANEQRNVGGVAGPVIDFGVPETAEPETPAPMEPVGP